jgi:hypothetical protein
VTFELLSQIVDVEVIARGGSVRRRVVLRKRFGAGQWRKLKGVVTIRLANGRIQRAEIHWYEAHGIGKVGMKVKRYLD